MIRNNIFFITLLFMLYYADLVYAQGPDSISINSEVISVKDGLSQGLISSIIQDKDGFMWFGTKDGLNKYDGYNFTIYRYQQGEPHSLPDNYVTALAEDNPDGSGGNLWVGTNTKGLFLFDKKHEKFYPVKLMPENDSLSFYTVFKLQSRHWQLLVQTGQLIIYDVSRIKINNNSLVDLTRAAIHFSDRKMLPENRYFTFQNRYQYKWMDDKTLWFTYNDSVFVFSENTDSIYRQINSYSTTATGLSKGENYHIEKLPQANLCLLAGVHEILIYNFKTSQVVSKSAFNDNYPWSRYLIKDKSGNYFISGLKLGYYFNVLDHTLKPVKGSLGNPGCIDSNGILWTLTSGHGIIKSDYRKQLFHVFTNAGRVSDLHNNAGELLILENRKTFYFLNAFTQKKRPVFPSEISKEIISGLDFTEDQEGNYWLLYGIESLAKKYLIKYNPLSGELTKKEISHLKISTPVTIIIGTRNNVFLSISDYEKIPRLELVNRNTLFIDKVYNFPAKIQNYGHFVTDYYNDANGKLWLATLQGLYQFDQIKNAWLYWQNIADDKNSLNNNQLLSILPDPSFPEKYLWIGTDGGGLNRMEIASGKFIKYTEKNGLPNNVVYGLLSDKAGNIWMSTNRGLSCGLTPNPSPKEKGETALTFMNFNSEDGLPGDEFQRTEYFKMPNGNLYFGGVEGAVIFDPEKILEKEKAPPIVFTGLSVFNKPVSHITDSSIINMPMPYAQTITLPHGKGMFTISFAALEYRAASKKYYRYFLDGYDKYWIDAGNKNEATYTNLSPGTYTFFVTGAGSTGVWNQKGASIKIVILPAWWQTWWFRLLASAALISTVYAFYRYRLKQQLKLMRLRNRIASDLHDEIGSTISSISLSSNIIQKKLNGKETEVTKLVNQISNNTSNIMEVISDIVWTINTKNDSFENVIDRMRAFAVEVLENKNIMVHFNIDESANAIHLDMDKRKNLYLIFKESINNAAKYSQCKNVWIEIKLIKGNIRLQIRDDGIGFNINEDQKNKLSGNGLYNMRKRADDLKGKFEITSGSKNGTTVLLEFETK